MVNLRLDNGEIITVAATEDEWFEEKNKMGNTVIYHPNEIKEHKGLDRSEVLQIHEAKRIFRGFLGDGIPKKKRKKSSLSEMRKKCRQKRA
tara:strand:- start:538 stop:810 length:273 start_codon:yes stop_codon:yes gene_type:complete